MLDLASYSIRGQTLYLVLPTQSLLLTRERGGLPLTRNAKHGMDERASVLLLGDGPPDGSLK